MKVLGEAWRVKTPKVPKELLDAYPLFQKSAVTMPLRQKPFKMQMDAETPPSSMSVDWRTTGKVQTPKYQGPYNTCTSFAIVSVMESLNLLIYNSKIVLAPGFIHTCLLGREPNQGVSAEEALDAIVGRGVAFGFINDYPFPEDRCNTGNLYKMVKGRDLISGTNASMHAVASRGPIVADMFIEKSFLELGPSDIYYLQSDENKTLHTVAVVGYDFSQRYWIISNSYGTKWGDDGFGFVGFGSGGLLDERDGLQIQI